MVKVQIIKEKVQTIPLRWGILVVTDVATYLKSVIILIHH